MFDVFNIRFQCVFMSRQQLETCTTTDTDVCQETLERPLEEKLVAWDEVLNVGGTSEERLGQINVND